MRVIAADELAAHASEGDCWVAIDNLVLDVSRFAGLHPGGEQLLIEYGGKDVTEEFYALHRTDVLEKYRDRLVIGTLAGGDPAPVPSPGAISTFPYGEFVRETSPFYNESHYRLRRELRAFIDEHIAAVAEECERSEEPVPEQVHLKLGAAGIYAAWVGPKPGHHLNLVDKVICDLKPGEMDYHHEAIIHSEFSRLITPGFEDGLVGGRNISVPALLWFASKDIQERVVPPILRGERHSALAITEPFAGTDVQRMRCTATKSPCGKFYIVNGVKKWITEGHKADHFVTLVKTSGSGGRGGMSMLLIDTSEGVSTKLLKTVYSSSARTAYVVFENVKVPVENLIGKENEGFTLCMHNFNHERWMIAVKMLARARRIVEETFKWTLQRQVFGKPLVNQPVIQEKLAAMISRLEACQCWEEQITQRMCTLSFEEQNKQLAGEIALFKYEAAQLGHVVADGAVVCFGGRAMSKAGMGHLVERYQRTYRLFGVYGGSTDVMASLGIKQALRNLGTPVPKL